MISEVEVRPAPTGGLGVFARRAFAPGELVLRRRHLPITPAEVATLPAEQRDHVRAVGDDRLALVAPPGCYLNHSCVPSAVRHGVDVLAVGPIAAGEEITLDYRIGARSTAPWTCRCGAPTCVGTIGPPGGGGT